MQVGSAIASLSIDLPSNVFQAGEKSLHVVQAARAPMTLRAQRSMMWQNVIEMPTVSQHSSDILKGCFIKQTPEHAIAAAPQKILAQDQQSGHSFSQLRETLQPVYCNDDIEATGG